MFWRRREPEPAPPSEDDATVQPSPAAPEAATDAPPPMTVARPARAPGGMGLRARPSGLGERLRAILGAGSLATDETWDEVEETLIAGDVGGATTLEIVDAARERMRREGGRSGEDARRALATEIRDRLAASGSGEFVLGDAPAVILFVGVNGTGKTTTIAKLAARAALIDERRVQLITLDNYRIGGIDQIRTYAELMGVPLAVAESPARLVDVIDERAELTLIDTAGRSPRDLDALDELVATLDQLPPIETHVVIPAATSAETIDDLVARFRPLRPKRLLFTKLDEVERAPELATAPGRCGLPITWVTTGQAVPEDIEEPTRARVLELSARTTTTPRTRAA